jgi:pilus assembly protein CpaE
VRDLESRRRPVITSGSVIPVAEEDKPVKTIAVYSPRGGVGTSTVALNLALAMHDEIEGRVLLVEGKLAFGHLDVLLNLRTRNTLADLIPHANALDSGLVAEVVAEHATGLQVVLGPTDLQVAQGIRAEDLFNVLEGLKRLFDFLVIDAGSALNENTVTILDASDRVLLVATPELAALHDVSRFVQLSRSLGYPPGKLLVVLNRAGQEGGVKTKDIESALHHELFGQVPEDGANALRSLNRGLPLVVRYPRSPASRAYQQLARQLKVMGAGAPARAEVPARNGKGKEKTRRSPKRSGAKA